MKLVRPIPNPHAGHVYHDAHKTNDPYQKSRKKYIRRRETTQWGQAGDWELAYGYGWKTNIGIGG